VLVDLDWGRHAQAGIGDLMNTGRITIDLALLPPGATRILVTAGD